MSLILTATSIVFLGILVYQDFRFRSVNWILLPCLFILFFLSSVLTSDFRHVVKYVTFNFAFIIIQLVIVILYFRIRNGRISDFTSNIIGWGDILFFFAVTPVFPLPTFIIYLITGMFLILLACFIIYLVRDISIQSLQIPLAGILAAYVIVLKTIQWFYPHILMNINDSIANSLM